MKIKTDSRKVEAGDTFIALKGVNHDGHDFIEEAIESGAALVVAEHGNYSVDTILVDDTHEYLAEYLSSQYSDMLKNMHIIGATGTNGKTTTCYLLYSALNKLGIRCGYIGTIGFYLKDKIKDLNNTTPDILEIYEMLIYCYEKECNYVIMEVSSQALSMNRVDGLLFDYVIFTNLTQDHLDYHKTMKKYALAKQKLFYKLKKDGYALINIDDEYSNMFLLSENNNITYGKGNSDYKIIDSEVIDDYQTFIINHNGIWRYDVHLLGEYNIYNTLAVIIILEKLGFDFKQIYDVVFSLEPPTGRMEKIKFNDSLVIIDYAHTPDATSKIISSAKTFCKGKIYTIIGCGGNRDNDKRAKMGLISATLSDYVIFTSDNPRNEDPEKIIDDMLQLIDRKNYEIIINREKAIKKGIQKLKENDILLILGKGHEEYQIIGTEKKYFSDKKIVLDML